MLKLGYKASAEQFAPRELLEFACLAEEVGFESVFISDHFQPWRHTGGHAPVLAVVARRARGADLAHRHGDERADADVPLSPRGRRPGLRHARHDVPGPGDPGRGHRRVAQRDARHRHGVAGAEGAHGAIPRGHRPDQAAVERGAGLLSRRVLPDAQRHHLRPAVASRCRSTSRPQVRWSPSSRASAPRASSARAGRTRSCTATRCCQASPQA